MINWVMTRFYDCWANAYNLSKSLPFKRFFINSLFLLFINQLLIVNLFAQSDFKSKSSNRKSMSIDIIEDKKIRQPPRKIRYRINNIEDAQLLADRIKKRFDRQVNNLYRQLNITNQQQTVWDQYITANRNNLPSADLLFQRSQRKSQQRTPTHEKQDLIFIRNHLEKMQISIDAYDSLYNQCSSIQQKILREIGFPNNLSKLRDLPINREPNKR